MILRTCDRISNKFWLKIDLLAIKKMFFENTIKYALANKYELYVICDSDSIPFKKLLDEIFQGYAHIIKSSNLGNAGSFKKQIDIALSLNADYIEFAEDDFLKYGLINFDTLNANSIYTAYDHPNHEKFFRKHIELLFNNKFSTVCSFILHKSKLKEISQKLYNYNDDYPDSDVWYNITTPLIVKSIIILFRFLKGNDNNINLKINQDASAIKRLNHECTWIHCANDSLPLKYKDILKCNNLNEIKNYIANK